MSNLRELVSREALVKSLEVLTGRKDVQLLDDYQVRRASDAIEGFASLVLRIHVSYRLPGENNFHSHVFVVKTMPQTKYQRDMLIQCKIFSKEWLVFSQAAPLMKKVSAGRVQVPLPECYHGFCEGDDAALYMEDLVAAGYRAVSRSYFTDGLDYAHCSVAMKALGRFHALSVAAERTLDPGSGGWIGTFPEFDRDRLYFAPGPDDPPPPSVDMIEGLLKNFKEMCDEMDGLPKKAVESGALDAVLQGVYPTLCRLKQTPTQSRRVLAHGDCWMNNMMYRYEMGEEGTDKPVDARFFDLQLTRCSHPGTDFLYFLNMCARKSTRDKYFQALVEDYHKSFSETLLVLGEVPPPFTLQEFEADVTGEYNPYGHIIGILYSPMLMLGDEFLLPNANDLTEEVMQEYFHAAGTKKIKLRFRRDPKYRSYIEENAIDFLKMAFPKGLGSVESSPLLLKTVN